MSGRWMTREEKPSSNHAALDAAVALRGRQIGHLQVIGRQMDKEQEARDAVERRIEEIKSAKDPDAVLVKQLRLMGYMEALEDQGLLSDKEVSAYDAAADKAADQRNAEWLERNRQDKSK